MIFCDENDQDNSVDFHHNKRDSQSMFGACTLYEIPENSLSDVFIFYLK